MVITTPQVAKLLEDYQISRWLFGALRQLNHNIKAMHVTTAKVYDHVLNTDIVITDMDVKK